MKTISVHEFCKIYDIPESFIVSLSEFELIALLKKENEQHIDHQQIATIEKLMRLHYDLAINFEGLDVINNLMNRIVELQNELQKVQNQLEFYK